MRNAILKRLNELGGSVIGGRKLDREAIATVLAELLGDSSKEAIRAHMTAVLAELTPPAGRREVLVEVERPTDGPHGHDSDPVG